MYVRITGKRAMFSRPEMRAERYSYDMITPSAAEGLLKSIYWKPEMEYAIKRILVVNPPQFETIMTNDTKIIAEEKYCTKDGRTTRHMTYLKDVDYVIDFGIRLTGKGDPGYDNLTKHYEILKRRLEIGQSHRPLCLGVKEFTANAELIEKLPKSKVKGYRDLGIMMHHLNYDPTGAKRPESIYFHAVMNNGMVDVSSQHVFNIKDSRHGWVFQELVTQYDRMAEAYALPVLGYSREKIFFEAVISPIGELIEFNPLHLDQKGKVQPEYMTVPTKVIRTSGTIANCLYDVPSYAVGWPAKGNEEEAKENFRAFRKKIKDVIGIPESEAERAIIAFTDRYEKELPNRKMLLPYEKEMELSRKIVFRLKGEEEYIHDDPSIMHKWELFYKETLSGPKGLCMVTGRHDVLVEKHPAIEGVANTKQNSGKLVSINGIDSFYTYGARKLIDVTPMGVTACHKYSAMLNYYMSSIKQKIIINGITFIYWSETDNEDLLKRIRYMFTGLSDEKPEWTSEFTYENFYILGLAPVDKGNVRIGVRYFEHFTDHPDNQELIDFANRIRRLYIRDKDTRYTQDWGYIMGNNNQEPSEKPSRAFLIGQLFAVLDRLQTAAVKSTVANRSSIAYKLLEQAATRPSSCMPMLVRKSYAHSKKIKIYRLEAERERLIEAISEYASIDGKIYPDRMNMHEQEQFQLGFTLKMNECRKEAIEAAKKKKQTESKQPA